MRSFAAFCKNPHSSPILLDSVLTECDIRRNRWRLLIMAVAAQEATVHIVVPTLSQAKLSMEETASEEKNCALSIMSRPVHARKPRPDGVRQEWIRIQPGRQVRPSHASAVAHHARATGRRRRPQNDRG
jgi:hypothetical protein